MSALTVEAARVGETDQEWSVTSDVGMCTMSDVGVRMMSDVGMRAMRGWKQERRVWRTRWQW